MARAASNPRRFAPLNGGAGAGSDLPKLRGIVFDVDGTLCEPQNYMFAQMRAELGITKSEDILDHVYSRPTAAEQEEAMEKIRAIERTAMSSQVPQPGLRELMTHLDAARLPKAICTRNFDAPVAHLLSRFLPDLAQPIHPIITRDFRPPKPDPAGILFIARSWGLFSPSKQRKDGQQQQSDGDNETTQGEQEVDASGLIMVGDSIDDMTAGRRAGAATVLLTNPANAHLEKHPHTDLVIRRLDELPAILDNGFVGRFREDGEGGAADSAA